MIRFDLAKNLVSQEPMASRLILEEPEKSAYGKFLRSKEVYDELSKDDRVSDNFKIISSMSAVLEDDFSNLIRHLVSSLNLAVDESTFDKRKRIYIKAKNEIDVYCADIGIFESESYEPRLLFYSSPDNLYVQSILYGKSIFLQKHIPLLIEKCIWPFRKYCEENVKDLTICFYANGFAIRPANALPEFIKITKLLCERFTFEKSVFEKLKAMGSALASDSVLDSIFREDLLKRILLELSE